MKLRYRVRVEVADAQRVAWIEYMDRHIQEVIDTGCFDAAELLVMTETEFVISYLTDQERFKRYNAEFAEALKRDHNERFPTVFATREVLKVLTVFKPK